jgi:bacterioferritin
LFLGGHPDISARIPLKVGKDIPEIYRINLGLELEVAAKLKEAIACCESCGDYQSRETFQKLLSDTEKDHIIWLETQLGLIDKIGVENYLQSQM